MSVPVSIDYMVKNNFCTGCGLCISESTDLLKLDWDNLGFLSPIIGDQNKLPSNILRVCPFNPNPEPLVKDEDQLAKIFLKESSQYDESVGCFEDTYVGYSKTYRKTSSSGGIATFIFEQLLKQKIVDYLFTVREVNGLYEYKLIDSIEDISKISKTRYYPVTLEKLFEKINDIDGKIAVSGVACFVKALRLKQYYHPKLQEKIPFVVGIICGGWKSRFFTDFLAQSAGITTNYKKPEYRIKDEKSTASDYSFGAFDSSNVFHKMKMAVVGDMWGSGFFKSRACDFCTDVLTELADISLGDAWLPEYRKDGLGNSVIITRSRLANQLIKDGINSLELAVKLVPKEEIIKSQKSSFTHRRDGLAFRLKIAKLNSEHLPHVRERVLKSVSLSYAIVQLAREYTRKCSLNYWKCSRNVKEFNSKMKFPLRLLNLTTRIYHKLR